MPGPDLLRDLTAWSLQIACIAVIAELMARLVPVRAVGFGYAYWRLVLAAALVMPWLLRAAPRAAAAVEPRPDIVAAVPLFIDLSAAAPAWTGSAPLWPSLVAWILAAGCAARFLWVAAGIVRLGRLARTGVACPDTEYGDIQELLGTRADIRAVAGLAQPVTFGVRRPVVLIPERLAASPDAIRRAVVTHELVHVQRRDWVWVIGEEAIRGALWFHPAIWWITSRIRRAREEFTDHVAVLATGSRRAYMEALLSFADTTALQPAPAFARRAHLFQRIVLLSKEIDMSSQRVVMSGAVFAAVLVAGTWYASDAFPLTRSTPAGALAMASPVPQPPAGGVNVVTPENPIPRRVFSPAVPYPLELAGTGLGATVHMQVVLDAGGSVAARYTSVRFAGVQPTSDTERERAVEAFAAAAMNGVGAWHYDPPFNAPLAFSIALQFSPGEDATVTQSAAGPRFDAAGAAVGSLQETVVVGRASPVPAGTGIPAQTRRVDPVYPEGARSARVSGVVILEATIDEQGRVSDPRILRSIPLLDRAALDAVRQWEYAPTLRNGVPVPLMMTVTMQFPLAP